MRARIFLCITLLYLCHPQLWPQAVTKQFPPAAGAQPTGTDSLPDDPSASSEIPVAKVIPAPPTGVPVEIRADTQREINNVYTLTGNVVIYYRTYVVQADKITYNRDTGDVAAEGHLIVDGSPDNEHITATHGEMNLDQDTAHFYDVVGTLGVATVGPHSRMVFTSPNPFAITGREVIKLGTGRYRVIDGTMTSCRLPKPDWRLLSKQINMADGKASARNTWFELMSMPLFYLPYVTHPVDGETRTAGILLPIVGNSTTKGLILGEEIYFPLSRNSDLTIGTEYFSKRGYSPMGMFRYRGFGEDFFNVRFHALFDRLPAAENQGGTDLLVDGRRDWGQHTRAVVDAEYLSSYAYRQAFEENYAIAINSEVKSQFFGAHALNGFAENLRFDRYQSFQNNTTNAEIRILHLPALQLEGEDHYLGKTPWMWGGIASVAVLSRAEPENDLNTATFRTRGVPRVDFHPHLAMPFSLDGWTFRPEVAVRDTFYGRSQNPAQLGVVPSVRDASVNRKDFEAGIDLRPPAIERDFTAPWLLHLFGGDLRHTVEPDVQYHYVSGIDNFDSILRFDDVDIASDTSELDYSLTQRLFLRHLHPHPCKGDEALGPDDLCGGGTVDWLSWQVAQKYFFNTDFGGAVTTGTRNVLTTTLDLTGVAFLTGPRTFSPVISRFNMRTSSATNVQWDLDYDPRLGRITASNVYAEYKKGDYAFSVGDFHLNAPEAPPTAQTPQTAVTNATSNYNQLRFSASYGASTKAGLSAGTSIGYDFVQNQLQYGAGQAGYNWDCCGLSFEVRRYSLGTVRDDTQYLYSFTLAGVGSAGSLRRAARIF
ncbi:LPS-assembly protein LptD [Alloacidobacterium dinghuense]|uniref:LPS-assembly protein LptD n=1 Tax=Alloacidobacterium dinghuense TaxID=2763107 RepID=A0A7G8BG10_9BACT|nr:LPS assembly protein LptD [Alloacidobacterium dinghuense]QNI31480.1 LPS-assembly protein LptD [Alloacidobacterium dinghuense]